MAKGYRNNNSDEADRFLAILVIYVSRYQFLWSLVTATLLGLTIKIKYVIIKVLKPTKTTLL